MRRQIVVALVLAFLIAIALASCAPPDLIRLLSVKQGTLQEVQDAIKKGANVNAKDDATGWTPLMYAVQFNQNLEVITVLLKAGADTKAQDKNGMTPLIAAAQGNYNPEVISVLLKAGADVNAKNNDGTTPLITAAHANQNPEVISVLLKAGADVNAKSNDGMTPLMVSGQNQSSEVISVLLKAGADVNARSNYGWTPLMYAAHGSQNPDVIAVLLKAGADLEARDKDGETPLMQAAEFNQNPEVITVLLKAGANLKVKDNSGKMAFYHAKTNQTLQGTDAYWKLVPDLRPSFSQKLEGKNFVRVRNPNDFSIDVGIRSGIKGKDFHVAANGVQAVSVPDGNYDIYFVYSNQLEVLWKGDSFALNNNGVEIQIVQVANGNYHISQVQ